MGFEAEGSYRTSSGWYGFGGAAIARVGSSASPDEPVAYGDVVNAPKLVVTGGVSTPKLLGYAHLSLDGQFLSRRRTRRDPEGNGTPADPWLGLNATIYIPNISGFDFTVGGKNLIGVRDDLPATGDYDRFPDPMDPSQDVFVPRIPGEGREVYVKVGYTY
jgi:hypothetical protein